MLSDKGERRQASPLTVVFVVALETFVTTVPPCADVVVAGTMLFCIHSRARFGDLVRADQEPTIDVFGNVGFIEVRLLRHKMARIAPDLRLPTVALAFGVQGAPWAQKWLEARVALGVRASVESGQAVAFESVAWPQAKQRSGSGPSPAATPSTLLPAPGSALTA